MNPLVPCSVLPGEQLPETLRSFLGCFAIAFVQDRIDRETGRLSAFLQASATVANSTACLLLPWRAPSALINTPSIERALGTLDRLQVATTRTKRQHRCLAAQVHPGLLFTTDETRMMSDGTACHPAEARADVLAQKDRLRDFLSRLITKYNCGCSRPNHRVRAQSL